MVSSPREEKRTQGIEDFDSVESSIGHQSKRVSRSRRTRPFLEAISGNWLGEMYKWMLQYGNKTRRRGDLRPALPMSQRNAKNIMVVLVRAMRDMGYLHPGITGRLVPSRSPTKISVPGIEAYMRERFPGGDMTVWSPSSHRNYTAAFRKMAEFLCYGRKDWSRAKMEVLRERLPFIQSDYQDLEINPPHAAMAFCEWLWNQDDPQAKVDSMVLFLGQHVAMRYSEVVDAPAALNDADRFTLKVDFRTKRIWVRGKGRGGKGRKLEGPPLARYVEQRLRAYSEWRREFLRSSEIQYQDLPYLVFTKSPQLTMKEGTDVWTQMSAKSGRFNVRLKRYAVRYNDSLRSTGSDRYIDPVLAKSHSMGRHVYGTFWAKRIHPKMLIRYMRISDRKGEGWAVVRKYINFDRTTEAMEYNELAPLEESGGGSRARQSSPLH